MSDDYVFGCQSVNRLATKYKVSQSTIRRRLDSLRSTRIVSSDKHVVVLMDTTYWGWKFGVVVFKDARTSKILWRKFLSKRETLADYQEGVFEAWAVKWVDFLKERTQNQQNRQNPLYAWQTAQCLFEHQTQYAISVGLVRQSSIGGDSKHKQRLGGQIHRPKNQTQKS